MDKFRVLVSETVVVLPLLLYASNKDRPFTARGAVSLVITKTDYI
jgi:hypothetical protein